MDDFDFGDEGGIFAGQDEERELLPTRTNQQKTNSFNQEWDALMPSLAKAYIQHFNNCNSTPQLKETSINHEEQLCECAEPDISFLHVDCIYITGTVSDFFKIY